MRSPVSCLVLLVGCASAHASADKPLDPLPLPSPNAGLDAGSDPGGDADFRIVARRAATADDPGARAALESFLAHHPHHHQRPAATAMLTGVLLIQGDASAAKTLLVENASMLQPMERDLFGGLCAGQLRDHGRAIEMLKPYLRADPPLRLAGLPDHDLRRVLRLTLAESLAAAGNPGDGIDQLELYAQVESNRPAERTYALRRAEELAAKLPDAVALEALVGKRGLFARAVLGQKGVSALRTRGDTANAARLDLETLAVRRQLGLEPPLPSAVPADPSRLGFVVPLTGPQYRLGEVVLRGASLMVASAGLASQPAAYHLVLRDSAAPPDRSEKGGGTAAGILALAREEKAIGVVSTPDARGVEFAARENLPVILLDERTPATQTTAFSLLHSNEARAVALARKALALGAHRFAILAPDNASGKRLSAAFKRAVEDGQGALTAHVTYAPSATSFSAEVANLRKFPFEALFIPDDASRLELVAPALAVADLWPRSPRMAFSSTRATSASGPGRREALLLSTALGLSPKFLGNVGRYVQGALFCPGFYPAEDARSGSFVARFRETFASPPTATDAYGYDAVSVLRGAVERGAKTRADVLRVLSTQTFEGLTGDIRFGPDRSRIDPPLIYVVEGDGIRSLK